MSARSSRGRKRGEWKTATGLWANIVTFTPSVTKAFPLIQIIPVVTAAGTPSVPTGAIEVTEVEVNCDLQSNTAGPGIFGLGLYIGKYDDANGDFSVQDPLIPADCQRPNWLHLHVRGFNLSTNAAITGYSVVPMSFRQRRQLRIEEGDQLTLQGTYIGAPASTLQASLSVRWKQLRVF